MQDLYTTRQKLITRWQSLKSERASWLAQWMDLSRYILPMNGRFFRSDRNRGYKRNNLIYDNTATLSVGRLVAGMLSSASSPARPWLKYTIADTDLMSYQPVRIWLDQVTQTALRVFQKSNTYDMLVHLYGEMAVFGTGANLIVDDYNTVIHNHPLTCGEYCIETDWSGKVCTLYREFEKQVSQIVKEFGYENCSMNVRNLYDNGKGLDSWIPIVQAIEPRADRDTRSSLSKDMPWASYYFELGAVGDKMLRVSGYKDFPAVAPRWEVMGGDVYGRSAAMNAIGDIKGLQQKRLRQAKAIDQLSDPAIVMSSDMKNKEIDTLPGGITYVGPGQLGAQVTNLRNVSINLGDLQNSIAEDQQRIRAAFYNDVFAMPQFDQDANMTATEVSARREEQLVQLGPIAQRMSTDCHYPLAEMTFMKLLDGGALPPPPDELRGQEINVEVTSVLAQAQRAVGINAIDRFVGSIGQVAQISPDVLDRFDSDKWVDVTSDMLGVDPSIVRGTDQCMMIRQQRAQAQAEQQKAAMAEQQANTAKALAQAPTGGQPNALTDMMSQLTGYSGGGQ